MDTLKEINTYLSALVERLRTTLTENLVGVYLFGSLAQDDFQMPSDPVAPRSDIDMLVVCQRPLVDAERQALGEGLPHSSLPCPAAGLELIVVTRGPVSVPDFPPAYEWAISTGATWPLEIEPAGGEESELLLTFALCRAQGDVLLGLRPDTMFATIPREWLLDVMTETIAWHGQHIHDPFHDPLGHFAVLNACRAIWYARTGVLGSKSAGGRWVLDHEDFAEPFLRETIMHALSIRCGERKQPLESSAVEAVLRRADSVLAATRAAA